MPKVKINFRFSEATIKMLDEMASESLDRTFFMEKLVRLEYDRFQERKKAMREEKKAMNSVDTPALRKVPDKNSDSDAEIEAQAEEELEALL